jgi:hypothetical protein
MICVIQCAASKQPTAGHMLAHDGSLVDFVADPLAAPPNAARAYARPDDLAEDGKSWRQHLVEYNKNAGNNPLGLLRRATLSAASPMTGSATRTH